jgi:preprotein translocase subunit SecG
MTKITAVLAIIFLGNSILLARLQDTKFEKSLLDSEKPISRPLNSDASAAKAKSPGASAPTSAPTATPAAKPANTTPTTTK